MRWVRWCTRWKGGRAREGTVKRAFIGCAVLALLVTVAGLAWGQFGMGSYPKVRMVDAAGVNTALVNASGQQIMNCVNCSGSGVSATDNTTFAISSGLFVPAGGVFNDGVSAVASGQQAAARITNLRALHTNLRTAAGAEIG